MKINFKKLHPNAKMPERAHDSDYGYDVYAVTEEEIAPNVWKYGLGFALQPIRGSELVDCIKTIISSGSSYPDCSYEEYEVCTPNRIDLAQSPINIGISLRPRSSIYKTGMVLANSIGLGDINYTGQYCAIFYHVMPNMPRYKVGDKIAQMHLDFTFPMELIEVDELSETDRGEGGFGSTGK